MENYNINNIRIIVYFDIIENSIIRTIDKRDKKIS